ncbi:MAG: hypothetical protein CMH56_16890 [Myxococcales bacterium]|nr:hypothetical protein [Myxococcales bacterium]|tara:strand:+ start:257 stop:814 length:558 start_codon:yes stop_codon:yes gene_type:complete
MTKNPKTNASQILSEAIDGSGTDIPGNLAQAHQAIQQVRSLYNDLAPQPMPQASKDRIVQFMNEAYEAEFGLVSSPQQQAEGLFHALKTLSGDNVPQVIETWSKWASQQAAALTEAEFVGGLRIFRRIARECSLEDFCATVLEGEIPPVTLRADEMEALCAGKSNGELGKAMLAIPKSVFTNLND